MPLKYHRWYDGLMDRAKLREIPSCYTELHHIVPRSLGGTDTPINLVRLTYREHFLAHWLLTKLHAGGKLRRMQRAMFAMTLPAKGRRIVAGWQFEAAKRAVRDLELDPEAERQWYERWAEAKKAKEQAREEFLQSIPDIRAANMARVRETAIKGTDRDRLAELSSQFLKFTELVDPGLRKRLRPRDKAKERRYRPSKTVREAKLRQSDKDFQNVRR